LKSNFIFWRNKEWHLAYPCFGICYIRKVHKSFKTSLRE